jgi:flavin-dependent dehydrogenase
MTARLIAAMAGMTGMAGMAALAGTWALAGQVVEESARRIPVAYEVDVVVVGGTTQATEAAAAAAKAGAKVFLAAPRNYLGDDMCGTLRLWLEPGREPATELGRRLFEAPSAPAAPEPAPADAAKEKAALRLTTPMQVKTALDEALIAAKADFLYGCYATDILRDADGKVAGIVMANRAGRQAVVAKVVIDATARGAVARMAGAKFQPYPAGNHTFTQVVIGGQPKAAPGVTSRVIGQGYPIVGVSRGGELGKATGKTADIIEYTLTLPMADGSFASLAAADQAARDRTWSPEAVRVSEQLFEAPPDAMVSTAPLTGAWPGDDKADIGSFIPQGVERMYVIGGCADVPRGVAADLLRPTGLMGVARRIGQAAAEMAKSLPAPRGVKLPGGPVTASADGEVREVLTGVRPTQNLPTIPSEVRGLPVLGKYDVVVIGGGTGGAPATIAAARKGARTLVVEFQSGLGGVSTLGLIGNYYHGYRGGFTSEIDEGVAALGGQKGSSTKVDWKMEYYRRQIRQAKGDIWFGAVGCGAFVHNGKVRGAVVATPHGRGVVLADVVIDATGNADVAASAGAQCVVTQGDFLAVQGAGLPPYALGAQYTNTDYTFADDSDMVDQWRLFVAARQKFAGLFDLGQLIDTRERRRIVGDCTLTVIDEVNGRTYPDVIAKCSSDYDSHGYTVDPMFVLAHPQKAGVQAYVPYRCLLPKGLNGMLVIGIGLSVHRDALPLVRMQPDVQNVGYAAGCAAAMAAGSGGAVRQIDIKALQKHLVETGCIPAEALDFKDSYPLSDEAVAEAVRDLAEGFKPAAVVLASKDRAIPLLKAAYSQAGDDKARLLYAQALAVCGDRTGCPALREFVKKASAWDKGWNFRGMGQYGPALSEIDRHIVALGMAREPAAAAVIIEKVKLLTPQSEFSHHRAVALALEMLGDKSAAKPLADLLGQPGMTGYAMHGPVAGQDRSEPLRELILARALYRLGDSGGVARKILESYTTDVRGHYARHAAAILQAQGGAKGEGGVKAGS